MLRKKRAAEESKGSTSLVDGLVVKTSTELQLPGQGTMFQKSDEKWNYLLEFDPSSNIGEIWVDSATLDYLNSLRDNIFSSSSKYDAVTLKQQNKKLQGTSLRVLPPWQTPAAAVRRQPPRQGRQEVPQPSKQVLVPYPITQATTASTAGANSNAGSGSNEVAE